MPRPRRSSAARLAPGAGRDRVPFFTIDPASSMDLDQAMHLERDGDGYRVRYAIADVPAFVAPGGALDTEARRRGQTVYCPDVRVPLHPTCCQRGRGQPAPRRVRPAFVWDLRLDAEGEGTSAEVYRAMVRCVERLDYEASRTRRRRHDRRALAPAERDRLSGGSARSSRRGGASLPMPEQEVHPATTATSTLEFRPPAPRRGVERPDLAAHRHGRRRHDAARPRRHPAHDARPTDEARGALPPAGHGARRPVAGRARLRRLPPRPRPHQPPPPGAHLRRHVALPRRGLHALRRGRPRAGEHAAVAAPTPTSRRPCAGSSTGSASSSARRCRRATRSPTRSAPHSRGARAHDRVRPRRRRRRAGLRRRRRGRRPHGRGGRDPRAVVVDHAEKGWTSSSSTCRSWPGFRRPGGSLGGRGPARDRRRRRRKVVLARA